MNREYEFLNGNRKSGSEKKRYDQGQYAPDPFLHEAIKEAIDRNSGTSQKTTKKPIRFPGFRKWIGQGKRQLVIEIGIVVLAVLFLFNVVINVSLVAGDSMKPAIRGGDVIVLFRLARVFEPGDIIVFRTSEGETRMKRIVAEEGDTVNISAQGELFVNGEAAQEEYAVETTQITDPAVQYPITVGEDSYFVLGDNRSQSQDSRNQEIGLVKKEDIIGRVVLSIRSF